MNVNCERANIGRLPLSPAGPGYSAFTVDVHSMLYRPMRISIRVAVDGQFGCNHQFLIGN